VDGRDEPGHDGGTRSDAAKRFARRKIFFIIFVDAIFTTLFERPFTNDFDCEAQIQQMLACIARATPINSLAT
jgi:hypothetical protein